MRTLLGAASNVGRLEEVKEGLDCILSLCCDRDANIKLVLCVFESKKKRKKNEKEEKEKMKKKKKKEKKKHFATYLTSQLGHCFNTRLYTYMYLKQTSTL